VSRATSPSSPPPSAARLPSFAFSTIPKPAISTSPNPPTAGFGREALHNPDALPAILQGYAIIAPLPSDLPKQIAVSIIRIGWFRLTQSGAATNPLYAAQLANQMTRLASTLSPSLSR
jgi:hypothetical protein